MSIKYSRNIEIPLLNFHLNKLYLHIEIPFNQSHELHLPSGLGFLPNKRLAKEFLILSNPHTELRAGLC